MVKVRFAPSPTGHLHIGNAKTALYNFLFAQKMGGIFILRMEDTDTERSEAVYEQSIMDDLRWLGITWQDGPFRQSQRLAIYRDHVDQLLEKGLAYKCFCTEEELAASRQKSLAKGVPPRYNGKCRDLSDDEVQGREDQGLSYTIRFRADTRPIAFRDGIRGEISFPRGHVDDLIIVRHDKTPTYNLAVVVDDMLMGVTDVIRGGDHISNTPKQIALFNAFGSPPPNYAHHSLLIGGDHKPLSKRHGATRVIDFRSMGIVRDALVNYLCTMGRKVETEIMDWDVLTKTFSLDSVSASDNIFDRDKLIWFNREYVNRMPLNELVIEAGLDQSDASRVSAVRENASTLNDLKDYMEIFKKPELNEGARDYLANARGAADIAHMMLEILPGKKELSFEEFKDRINMPSDIKKKEFFMILRTFITGRSDGPPLKDVFALVPADIIAGRIASYLQRDDER